MTNIPYVRTIGSVPPTEHLSGITVRQYDDQVVLLIPGGRTGLDAERREQFAQLWVRACNEAEAWKAARTEPERLSHEVLAQAKATGKCPLHGSELVYDPDPEVQASGDWQEHHICPSEGCEIGAWYG